MVNCPLCDAVIDVDEEELDEGDSLLCEECGANLNVSGVGPLELSKDTGKDEDDEDDEDEDEDLDEDAERCTGAHDGGGGPDSLRGTARAKQDPGRTARRGEFQGRTRAGGRPRRPTVCGSRGAVEGHAHLAGAVVHHAD